METTGANQASLQTGGSPLPMGEIAVVSEPIINPISTELAYSNDAKQDSSCSFHEIDEKASSDIESETADCHPSFQTLSDYFKVVILIYIYLGVGAICFYLVRHQISGEKTNGVLDAFYFTVILMTSIGYGELTPNTTLSLLLATLFAMVGILLTGAMWSLIAEMFLVAQQEFFVSETDDQNVMIKKCFLKLLAVYLLVFMTVGIVVLVSVENLDFIDAFYCINATIISVGSNKCFSTKGGRVFAIFWMLQGMGVISYILFIFTEIYTVKRQSSLVKKILERKMTLEDLDAADLDGDGVLVLAEYILYMLNEMEKLTRQDMEPIIEEYQRLGVNKKGLLTSDAHRTTMESDVGNQAPRPSFRTIPIPSSDRERKFADYFPWLHISYNLRKIIIILSIYLGAGTTCFYLVRHHISGTKTNAILDGLFFTLVITTSVGYGDLSPNSVLAIVLSSLFSVLGMFLLALVLSIGAGVLVKQQLHKIGPKTTAALPKHQESNKVRNKIILIVILFLVHMTVGTAILVSIEDLDFIHAFYCISITITSASSDKCFSTKGGRVFALFWVLLGTIYKGHVLFTFTELYTQRTQKRFVKRTITTTRADLEAADLDGDGVVVPAEYILLKLRENGKFHEKDVLPIIKRFQRLNIGNTGKLSLPDKMS